MPSLAPRSLALLSTLLLLGAGPAQPGPQPGQDPSFSFFYFDQELPLALDPGFVAVFAPPGAAGIAEALAAQGVDPDTARPHPIDGWWVVPVPPARATAAGVVELVRDLGRGPLFASPVFRDELGGEQIVPPEVLVGLDPDLDPARAEALLASFPGQVLERHWAGTAHTVLLRSAAGDGVAVLAAANALARDPSTVFAEPDFIFTGRGSEVPDDPEFPECWGLHNAGQARGLPDWDMDGPEAWDITWGDPSLLVMVIDTGVQQDHPDLNLVTGNDFTDQGPGDGGPVVTCDNHGTYVAGCISGIANNGLGVVGIAPGCKVFSARTFKAMAPPCDGTWSAKYSWTANALYYGESIGVRVSNNSNRYGSPSAVVAQAYAATKANGMVHFSSSGNQGSNDIRFPATLPEVNAVGATNFDGRRPPFSNYSAKLAFAAPGNRIRTTDRTGADGGGPGDYRTISGTSVASPYAAGVAALLLSVEPGLDAFAVEELMRQGAVDVEPPGHDRFSGWGFVNAAASLRALLGAAATVGEDGPGGERASGRPAVSADGRVVAFDSESSDLVAGDTNKKRDVFVRDLDAGTTVRVSEATGGVQANGHSFAPAISDDGRYVAFVSGATNLVTGDLAGWHDAFVHDRTTGATVRVSVKPNGTEANGSTWQVDISGDGQWVAFTTNAYNLAPSDDRDNWDVYVRDWQAGKKAVHVSVDRQGGPSNSGSGRPCLSYDGQRVAFQSWATDLVAGNDTNGTSDVFVRDLTLSSTTRVSDGPFGQSDGESRDPTISGDGQVVAFHSRATNLLTGGDTNGVRDVFVVDLAALGSPTRVSEATGGVQASGHSYAAALSFDGQLVAFESWAADLAPADTNQAFDVFLHDRATGTTERASLRWDGFQAAGDSAQPVLSASGAVGFCGEARDLVLGDVNEVHDTFLRDPGTWTTVRTSVED